MEGVSALTDFRKPLVFIDIDGVLNPEFSNKQARNQGFRSYSIMDYQSGWRYRVHLSREHGRWLNSLTDIADLAWATTWNDQANIHISPKIGLLELPVAETMPHANPKIRDHKLPGIFKMSKGRPFVWIDDNILPTDVSELDMYEGSFMLCYVNPKIGLTEQHIDSIREWISCL